MKTTFRVMVVVEVQKIKEENAEWVRIIEYMNQECIFMKNRLTGLLDLYNASFVVDWAEHFQNQILMKEQVLGLIKNDLILQELMILENELIESKDRYYNLYTKHEQIREQILYLEQGCLEMKQAFNDFVSLHMIQ